MNERAEILRYARDVILDKPEHWTKGAWVRDEDGVNLSVFAAQNLKMPEGFSYCTMGALIRAAHLLGGTVDQGIVTVLQLEARSMVSAWNDDPDTEYEDVLDLLDRAIKTLEEQ